MSAAGVTSDEWEECKAFAGFTDEQAAALTRLRPLIDAAAPDLVRDIQHHIDAWEEPAALIDDPEAASAVRRLKRSTCTRLPEVITERSTWNPGFALDAPTSESV